MADLNLTATWDSGVYRIETTDPVMGGESGISNKGAKNLGNRTEYLKQYIESFIGAGAGMRQAIISSKKTNTAATTRVGHLPDIIVSTANGITVKASATEPLILSISGGYTATGPKNYFGLFTADTNMTVSIAPGDGRVLIAKVNNLGVVELELIAGNMAQWIGYNPPTAGVVDGRLWYDLTTDRMRRYKLSTTSWDTFDAIQLCTLDENKAPDYPANYMISMREIYGAGSTPVGTVITSAAGTALGAYDRAGFLKCDGSAVSRTEFAALFANIGTLYGPGNGSTTFNIPDLRGEFVRGHDAGRGVDSARFFGSSQAHMLASHAHNISPVMMTDYTPSAGINTGMLNAAGTSVASYVQATGGVETRPRNMAMTFFIKF